MTVYSGPSTGPGSPRREPAWPSGAVMWIDDRLAALGLARTGDVEQPRVHPWSTVLRVPTAAGPVWFKANTPALQHEATIVTSVAARRPDLVPPLLAADPASGWMLMADAGVPLREVAAQEDSLHRWHDVLRRYAQLQLDLADQVPALLAGGVPDRRLSRLPQAYGLLLDGLDQRQGTAAVARYRAAMSTVDVLCAELDSYEVPELLQHDDLHDGQVYVRGDGGAAILDWGDACVSHPFFTLSVTLEGVLAWGLADVQGSVDTAPFRDSYLAPFAHRLDRDPRTLASATVPALRLGWLCRAINGQVADDDAKTLTRLRMFLDGTA